MFALDQPVREKPATFVVVDDFLPKETLDNIRKLAEQIPAEPGLQGSDASKRVCDIRWLHWAPGGGVDALYRKLGDVVNAVNNDLWRFHLGGFLEPLQLTHYKSIGEAGHYDWHADRSDRGITMNRKISGTLLLNDSFEGGEFELFDVTPASTMRAGSLILFPSFHVHRVKPVYTGERWSLVFWVTGPPFV
jgi:predicted 2-oxoglutarate/Fe(II)-dependent dioxygenase YbiX